MQPGANKNRPDPYLTTGFERLRHRTAPSDSDLAATPFGRGLRIGRILRFEIRLDFSVLLIFALLVMNLGAGVFAAWHPDWSPLLRWSMALAAATLFLGSILVHELTHAVVGRRLGVEIAGITLFLFGGLARMKREPDRAPAELWMAEMACAACPFRRADPPSLTATAPRSPEARRKVVSLCPSGDDETKRRVLRHIRAQRAVFRLRQTSTKRRTVARHFTSRPRSRETTDVRQTPSGDAERGSPE
jgi:hypothetical protein